MGKIMRLPKMTEYAHFLLSQIVQAGDVAIDATCGNGHDTLFLAHIVGQSGQVYAFDIQESAIATTRERLRIEGVEQQVTLIHDSHVHIDAYVKQQVKAVIFNLGYLPRGNKEITTTRDTSIVAIQTSLELLQKGGLLVLVVYPGHPAGKIERDAIEPWAAQLDERQYQVVKIHYFNQTSDAPFVLAIQRRG